MADSGDPKTTSEDKESASGSGTVDKKEEDEEEEAKREKEKERERRDSERARYKHHMMMRMMMMMDRREERRSRRPEDRKEEGKEGGEASKDGETAKADMMEDMMDDLMEERHMAMMASEMDFFMSSFHRRRWSPPPPSPRQILTKELEKAFSEKDLSALSETLKKWREMDRPFDLDSFYRRAYGHHYECDGSEHVLVKMMVEEGEMPLNTTGTISDPYANKLDLLILLPKFGLRGGSIESILVFRTHTRGDDVEILGCPIFWASYNAFPTIVRALIEAGARVRYDDDRMSSGLHAAVFGLFQQPIQSIWEKFDDFKEVCDILLENGLDIDARDERGLTPLAITLAFADKERNLPGDFIWLIVEFLLQRGADARARPLPGKVPIAPWSMYHSPVHTAARIGSVKLLTLLYGLDVSTHRSPTVPDAQVASPSKEADLFAPIMLAAEFVHLNTFEYMLLANDGDVNTQANALEMLGAIMAVCGEATRDDQIRYPTKEMIRRKQLGYQAAIMYWRRAARLRQKYNIHEKNPPVGNPIEFSYMSLFEPTTEEEFEQMGLSEIYVADPEDILWKGAVYGVAFLILSRLFAPRASRHLLLLQRASRALTETWSKRSVQNHRARMECIRKEIEVWKDERVKDIFTSDTLMLTCEHVHDVLRDVFIYQELVDEIFPFIEWYGEMAEAVQKDYRAGHVMDCVNRILRNVIIMWPVYYGRGRLPTDPDYYKHPVFEKYSQYCSETDCNPLHVAADRARYTESHIMHYNEKAFSITGAVVNLMRLWLTNGCDKTKRNSHGERPSDAVLKHFHLNERWSWNEEKRYNLQAALDLIYMEPDKETKQKPTY